MAAPAWLTARAVAHRGLHGAAFGAVENSPTAAAGAVARGYAVECDVQVTADGDAVVFHDDALDRLTDVTGAVATWRSRALVERGLKGSRDRIPDLSGFLGLIAGRVPLVCEIKSRFDGDHRLADRVMACLAAYPGPVALKSFDPGVIAHLRDAGCHRPLGIVAEASFDGPEWKNLSPARRHTLVHFLHYGRTRPDFLSYHVDDLPHAVPFLCRAGIGLPVLAWTVRTAEQRQRAADWGDQIVFEGFLP